MYFSSPEYTEPDVVGIFGNSKEMLSTKNDDIHSDISYRNMTYSPNTVLFLTDATIDLLIQGYRAVNAVQPVEMVVPIQFNELSGFSTNVLCTTGSWKKHIKDLHKRLINLQTWRESLPWPYSTTHGYAKYAMRHVLIVSQIVSVDMLAIVAIGALWQTTNMKEIVCN